MLGSAFRGTLREAQAGDEKAFSRLWCDANPLIVRYLRVIGADDPYDAACEGWITAIRGLTGYSGDEAGWRVWLLACARLRAEQDSERQHWATVTPLERRSSSRGSRAATAHPAASATTVAMGRRTHDELDVDALLDTTAAADPEHRGLGDTITALRALPLGQGEILVLRLAGALPVACVSDVVGSDAESVRRSEARALERLGADAELITWSLAAPATAAELADERVALGAFRSIPRPPAWSVPRTRVVTVGKAPVRGKAGRPSHGIANAAGRSRTALLGIATISASVMSLGGLSAAAYVGALPSGIQQVMHDKIGAPAPDSTSTPREVTPRSSTPSSRPGVGNAQVGSKVGTKPAPLHPTAQVTSPAKGAKPAKDSSGSSPTKTARVPRGTGSPTRTPSSGSVATPAPSTPKPRVTKSKASKPNVPGSKVTRTKGTTSGQVTDTTATSTTAPDPSSTTGITTPGS